MKQSDIISLMFFTSLQIKHLILLGKKATVHKFIKQAFDPTGKKDMVYTNKNLHIKVLHRKDRQLTIFFNQA